MDQIFRPEFADCWRYTGLRELRPTDALMQLVSIPSVAAMASWTVFHDSEDHVIVRRLHAPNPNRIGGRHPVFAADARMTLSNFQQIAEGAERLSKRFLAASKFGIDGNTFGVRWPNKPARSDITWWDGTHDSKELTTWFTAASGAFDQKLPAYSLLLE